MAGFSDGNCSEPHDICSEPDDTCSEPDDTLVMATVVNQTTRFSDSNCSEPDDTCSEPDDTRGFEEFFAFIKTSKWISELDFDGPNKAHPDRCEVGVSLGAHRFLVGPQLEYTNFFQAISEKTNITYIRIFSDLSQSNAAFYGHLFAALHKNLTELVLLLDADGSSDSQPNFEILMNQVALMLEHNTSLKKLVLTIWSVGSIHASGGFGFQRLVQPLIADANGHQMNSTLIKLQLKIHLSDESHMIAMNSLARMLQRNSSVQSLLVSADANQYSIATLAKALESNRTLKDLCVGGGVLDLERLVQPLTTDANKQQSNYTLIQLRLDTQHHGVKRDEMPRRRMSVVDSLTKMLQSNSSLKEFHIYPSWFFTEQDVCALITSLEKNYSLQVLQLPMSVSDSVFRAIMDMLVVNKTLKKIDRGYFGSSQEGKYAVLEQELKKNAIVYEESMSLLKDLPVVKATSARVFLCGYPFAGKNWCTKTFLNK